MTVHADSCDAFGEVFGVNFGEAFTSRIARDFTPKFREQHPGNEFAGYILHPRLVPVPLNPQVTADVYFMTSDDDEVTDGLLANVDHKGQFSLEMGLDSSVACTEPHLVIPGDFPYDGFIRYRGVWDGGSGVMKELDVVWVKKAVDIYAEVRGAVVKEVIEVVEWARENWTNDTGDWKYLEGSPEMLEVYRQAYAVAMAS